MSETIIQIGSHIGHTINDPIFQNVKSSTNLILVEPVPYLFEILVKNYNDKYPDNRFIFINKAVSNFIGEIEMIIPSLKNDFKNLPFWASQLSSINKDHVSSHIPEIITEKIKVKTTTINEIIKNYNIINIDLLHTDTEGHDYVILMDYDFCIKPKKIIFEYKHTDGVLKIGINLKILLDKLYSLNYKIVNMTDEDLTLILE